METLTTFFMTAFTITGAICWLCLFALAGMAALDVASDEQAAASENPLTAETMFTKLWNGMPEDVAPAWLRSASSLSAHGLTEEAEFAYWQYEKASETRKPMEAA